MRQQLLASLVVIGVIGAAATGATLALFSDNESSTGNTFAAGNLDLRIDWTETYNNETVQLQEPVNNPGPVFQLSDVKPGDSGEATISLDLTDNPGWVWMKMNLTSNDDVSSNEPELAVDDPENASNAFDGELAQSTRVNLWYDDGDNVFEKNETSIVGTGNCNAVNLDLSLTLDRSGSMSNPADKINAAKNGSKLLVDSLNGSDQAALVTFSSSATLDQELTFNHTQVKNKIDGISTGGNTNIADAINTSENELLNGTNARGDAVKVMVLLSDGTPNVGGDATAEATDAKGKGIRIITIALGDNADTTLLGNIASSPEDAYVAPTAGELDTVFQDISGDVCQITTLEDLTTATQDGVLLDYNQTANGTQPYPSGTSHLGFSWELPRETGNIAQSDATSFDMMFYTEQSRNNPNPTNPWTG